MRFDKDMVFLGVTDQVIKSGDLAGRTMYNVQMYDLESNAPVGVNVMDGNPELEKSFSGLTFGTKIMTTFDLRPDQGKWRIRLHALYPM